MDLNDKKLTYHFLFQSRLLNKFSIIVIKHHLMKNLISILFIATLTLINISPAQAGGCSYHNNKKPESECLKTDKECIDNEERKLNNTTEA